MNDAVRSKLQSQLAAFRDWSAGYELSACRLVRYCGVDLLGALDIPPNEIESRIEGLICEGFYVDWAEHRGRLYLRVWEYGGPEPDWAKVFSEQPLADIDELPRRSKE
jgi:hypothetical protein